MDKEINHENAPFICAASDRFQIPGLIEIATSGSPREKTTKKSFKLVLPA
jgi:hypothetical protein